MFPDLLHSPTTDPTSLYRYRDGLYAVDLLTAAICELDFFSWLAKTPADLREICRELRIKERPADVMLTLFTAMGLLQNDEGIYSVTQLGHEHVVKSSPWYVGAYFASVKERPVCQDILNVLRSDRPANWASLQNEREWARAMEDEQFAAKFTAAMDGRGSYLGPAMAKKLDCSGYKTILDIAGGSGIYACSIVARHPHMRASVLEKPPVDDITRRTLGMRGFNDRVEVIRGNMFSDAFPAEFDMHLFSNVLHDWDESRVRQLLWKSGAALPKGGMVVIHDAHINLSKTGPLPVAAYSALLMTITEGKCYSEGELAMYLREAGFDDVKHTPTAADRSIITAIKK